MRNGAIMHPGATTNHGATRIHGMNNYGGAVSNSIPVIAEGGYTIILVTTYARGVFTTNSILLYYIGTGYASIPATTYGRGVISTDYSVPYSTAVRHATAHTSTPAQHPHRSILRRGQQTSGAGARRYGVEEYYTCRSPEERREQ